MPAMRWITKNKKRYSVNIQSLKGTVMDWEFEVAKSDDLYNLIADGLAETTDCKAG